MKTYYIYSLINPLSGSAYYVGCTTNPKRRLATHRSDCDSNHAQDKLDIEECIRRAGLKPAMDILDKVDADGSRWPYAIEKLWTAKLVREGQPIVGGNPNTIAARYPGKNIDETIAYCKYRLANPNAPANMRVKLNYGN